MKSSEISVVIPTTRISEYLWETIDSVIEADRCSPVLEILVVPNAGKKTKEIADIIRTRYPEPRITVVDRKLDEVPPMFANWDSSVKCARGSIIHLLHDDDLVARHFYLQAHHLIEKWPQAVLYYISTQTFGAVHGHTHVPSPEGIWEDAASSLAVRNYFLCPGVLFRKSAHHGFDTAVQYTSDWRAWYKLAEKGPVVTSPYTSARYRMHAHNETVRLVRDGTNVTEVLETSVIQSEDYLKNHGIRLEGVSKFAAELGRTEARAAAARKDFRTAFLQLKLSAKADAAPIPLLRTFLRVILSLVR